jgi:hypothetical protein
MEPIFMNLGLDRWQLGHLVAPGFGVLARERMTTAPAC